MQLIGNYINGEMVQPVSEQFLDNCDPATGQVYSKVPDGPLASRRKWPN